MSNTSTVGALRVVLGIDAAQFEDGLTKAQATLKKVAADMERIGGQMQRIGLAIGAAVLAQATAIGAAMMKVSASVMEVASNAKKAGVEFEKFQALKYAAEHNLIGVNALTEGLRGLQISADKFIQTGKGPGAEAFQRLGLSASELKNRLKDPSALFEEIISRLQRVDKAAQLRMSSEIFGGSGGEEFVKFLDEGVDGIRRLKAEFAKSGNLISAEDLERAKALQTAVKNLQDAIDNLGRAFLRTGIAQWLTDVATKMAQWVTKVIDAVPALARWGTAVAMVGTALSVVFVIVGTVVSAIGTIIGAIGQFSIIASKAGVPIRAAFAALGVVWGPVVIGITALVAAWMIVKDQVLPVLAVLKERAIDVLGPTFAGLVEAAKGALSSLRAAFAALWDGPIGQGLRAAGDLLGGFAAILTRVFGEVGIAFVNAFLAVLTGAFNSIAIIVRGITALLSGDWEGAWTAAGDLVDNVVRTMISVFDALLPGVGGVLTSLYEMVKDYFVTGIGGVFDWVSGQASKIASAWGSAFGPAIQWAKGLYEGVKAWIVDRLGPMIQTAIDWVNALKAAFNTAVQAAQTGGSERRAPPPPAPPPPAPPSQRREPPPDPAASGSGKKPTGKTEAELAAQRELLRLQAELAAAKARGDSDEVRRLEDIIDRRSRIKAYESAGLTNAAAQVAADRDRGFLAVARAEATRKSVETQQDELTLQVAQLDGDRKIIDLMEYRRDLAKLVASYEADGLKTAVATKQAKADLLRLEDARLRTRQRLLAEARQEHAITLAQLSGNVKLAQQLQDQREVEQRSRRYQTEGLYKDPDVARDKAASEVGLERKAATYGEHKELFASAFSDGIRAAMAGDVKGFLSNQFGTFLSEAFKRAGAQLFDRLSGGFNAATEGATQGAAISATVTPALTLAGQSVALSIGSAIQVAGTAVAAAIASAMSSTGSVLSGGGKLASGMFSALPKFEGGGSILPSGASGIDSQLVSFWKSPREAVHVGTPSQMAGRAGSGGGTTNNYFSGNLLTPEFWEKIQSMDAQAGTTAFGASRTAIPAEQARRQRYNYG